MSLGSNDHMRCGRCAAPTRAQVIKGLNTEVCVSCGSVTLDQITLERLLGGPTSNWGDLPPPVTEHFPDTPRPVYTGAATVVTTEPESYEPVLLGHLPPPHTLTPAPSAPPPLYSPVPQASRPTPPAPVVHQRADEAFDRQLLQTQLARQQRQNMLLIFGLIMVLLLVVSVPVTWVAYSFLNPAPTYISTSVTPTDLGDVLAQEGGSVVAEPEVVPEPEPEIEPEPEPAPVAVQIPTNSVAGLVNQGWNLVASKPGAAAGKFRQALAMQPGHAEASYGLGYALLQQGDTTGAQPHLCLALRGNDIEVQRDVNAMLTKYNLTCR